MTTVPALNPVPGICFCIKIDANMAEGRLVVLFISALLWCCQSMEAYCVVSCHTRFRCFGGDVDAVCVLPVIRIWSHLWCIPRFFFWGGGWGWPKMFNVCQVQKRCYDIDLVFYTRHQKWRCAIDHCFCLDLLAGRSNATHLISVSMFAIKWNATPLVFVFVYTRHQERCYAIDWILNIFTFAKVLCCYAIVLRFCLHLP